MFTFGESFANGVHRAISFNHMLKGTQSLWVTGLHHTRWASKKLQNSDVCCPLVVKLRLRATSEQIKGKLNSQVYRLLWEVFGSH